MHRAMQPAELLTQIEEICVVIHLYRGALRTGSSSLPNFCRRAPNYTKEAISPLNAPSQPRPRLSVPIAADRTLQTSRVAPNPINTKTTKTKAAKNVWKERAAARKQNTNISKPSFAEVVKGSSNNALDAKEVMTKMAQMMSQWGEMLSLLQSKL
ncbi:hypothetical protein TNCV_994171 [Trichonephila clavipes]|nr:hypothetical protein TNCV_994171 [Trichonephila clavipes]